MTNAITPTPGDQPSTGAAATDQTDGSGIFHVDSGKIFAGLNELIAELSAHLGPLSKAGTDIAGAKALVAAFQDLLLGKLPPPKSDQAQQFAQTILEGLDLISKYAGDGTKGGEFDKNHPVIWQDLNSFIDNPAVSQLHSHLTELNNLDHVQNPTPSQTSRINQLVGDLPGDVKNVVAQAIEHPKWLQNLQMLQTQLNAGYELWAAVVQHYMGQIFPLISMGSNMISQANKVEQGITGRSAQSTTS